MFGIRFGRKTVVQKFIERAQEEKSYCLQGRVKPEHLEEYRQATTTCKAEWFEEEVWCSNCGQVFPSEDCEAAVHHMCRMTPENLAENLRVLEEGHAAP